MKDDMETEQAHDDTKKSAATDSYVGRAAVDGGLATAKEIEACISKRNSLKAQGKEIKLGNILVKTGVLTQSQLKRLYNAADDSGSQSFKQIPGFQIKRKIGAGAMAKVYEARQLSLDRTVAIKILPDHLSKDPEFVERFYKEGQAAAKMNHNNIVQAIDVGEYAGSHYFVMEYVDGETVYDELMRNRVYQEDAALNTIIQIARALEHAHARGLIHRDVKPKNMMITKDGTAKLADMGLARLADDVAAAEAEKGRAFGTPYYISPEQIRGVVDVDFRADIYSLGATLYHMVTGKVPFEGSTPTSIMQKHLKQPLTPPDHLNKSLSTGLAEVVEHMMTKNRKYRYQSTTDLLLDLAKVQEGKAPLQARSGFDDNLLKDLADGSEEGIDEMDSGHSPSYPSHAPYSQSATYPVGLIIAVILESMLIIVLTLLLIFTK